MGRDGAGRQAERQKKQGEQGPPLSPRAAAGVDLDANAAHPRERTRATQATNKVTIKLSGL